MLTEQTIALVEEMLNEEYCEVHGTIMLYEHQLTLEPKYRKVPEDQLEESLLRNLRLRAIHLNIALEEFKEQFHGGQ